jgi:NAD(P)-dependent dehydrogenase (short-subunit alcohol dehydrogenase family)
MSEGKMGHGGRVVLIMGGTGAIGGATALSFARQGAKVVLAGRNEAAAAGTVEKMKEVRAEATFIHADVTQLDDMAHVVEETVAKFGRLDCAFNNAGWEGPAHETADIDEGDWAKMLDVKLSGVWRGMKYQLQQMVRQGGGCIINMAGNWGLIGAPNYAAYCAAAHGIIGLTKTAALEYARRKVRVNAVCPGAVDTPMLDRMFQGNVAAKSDYGASIPLGRLAQAQDVAETVLWLSSDSAGYITGQAIVLSGGA